MELEVHRARAQTGLLPRAWFSPGSTAHGRAVVHPSPLRQVAYLQPLARFVTRGAVRLTHESGIRSRKTGCFFVTFETHLSAFTTAPKNAESSTTVDPVGLGCALSTTITTFSFRLMYRCCPKIPCA